MGNARVSLREIEGFSADQSADIVPSNSLPKVIGIGRGKVSIKNDFVLMFSVQKMAFLDYTYKHVVLYVITNIRDGLIL